MITEFLRLFKFARARARCCYITKVTSSSGFQTFSSRFLLFKRLLESFTFPSNRRILSNRTSNNLFSLVMTLAALNLEKEKYNLKLTCIAYSKSLKH